MNHTQGPWRVRKLNGSNEECFVEALVSTKAYHQEILADEFYPTKLADAILIASAPEMLTALNRILELTDMRKFRGSTPEGRITFIRDAVNEALEKARGER